MARKHTLESLTLAAQGFTTRTAFRTQHPSMYATAWSNGWLDHLGFAPPPQTQEWTFERIAEVSKRYRTRLEMRTGVHQRAYAVAMKKRWYDALPARTELLTWTREAIAKEAEGKACRAHMHPPAVTAALRDGHEDLLPPPGVSRRYWTRERVAEEAKQYEFRGDMSRDSESAYNAAVKHGYGDVLPPCKNTVWDCEAVAEACKGKSRHQIREEAPGAYAYAKYRFPDLLPPPLEGRICDNDCFYIWPAEGEWFNGLPVYKVGITSRRSGDSRTREVAKVGGFKRGKTLLFWVPDAMAVEDFALSLGVNPQISKTDGYTEFRAYTPEELATVIAHATRIQSENFVPSPARI